MIFPQHRFAAGGGVSTCARRPPSSRASRTQGVIAGEDTRLANIAPSPAAGACVGAASRSTPGDGRERRPLLESTLRAAARAPHPVRFGGSTPADLSLFELVGASTSFGRKKMSDPARAAALMSGADEAPARRSRPCGTTALAAAVRCRRPVRLGEDRAVEPEVCARIGTSSSRSSPRNRSSSLVRSGGNPTRNSACRAVASDDRIGRERFAVLHPHADSAAAANSISATRAPGAQSRQRQPLVQLPTWPAGTRPGIHPVRQQRILEHVDGVRRRRPRRVFVQRADQHAIVKLADQLGRLSLLVEPLARTTCRPAADGRSRPSFSMATSRARAAPSPPM
jgi:hypothetical protein